jgi:hypothetical protein
MRYECYEVEKNLKRSGCGRFENYLPEGTGLSLYKMSVYTASNEHALTLSYTALILWSTVLLVHRVQIWGPSSLLSNGYRGVELFPRG